MTKNNIPANAIEAAQQDAANARAAAHTAQERAARIAADAHAAAAEQGKAKWQEYLDGYDPQAQRAAVIEAEAALTDAFKTTPFGQALLNYVAAIHTERTALVLAKEATHSGAKPNESAATIIATTEPKYIDAHGIEATTYGYLSDFPTGILASTVHELATNAAQQLANNAHEAVQAAADSANAPTINAYKVTRPGFNGTEFDGLNAANFIDGVAYIPANAPKLNYFNRSTAYTVEPAYSIPEDWSHVERAITTAPNGAGFLATN